MSPVPMLIIMTDCMTHHTTSVQSCNILKIVIAKSDTKTLRIERQVANVCDDLLSQMLSSSV